MNSSNNNWKIGNERRVNLAMTAELALNNNAGTKNISSMQYNPSGQGAVPRVRGAGMEQNMNTNDILGTYKMQSGNGIGNSSKGFGYSEENKDLSGGYKPTGTSGLPPRGYNSNNEFNSFNTGLSTNNNINNQYKPLGIGGEGFGNFQTQSSNSSIQAESNGFKVQRVRGGQQQQGPSPLNNQNLQGAQTFGNANAQNNAGGYGLARNNSKKDENVDIDQQTKQLKMEIDSLDIKLGQKNNVPNSSNNNFYQNFDQQNNAFKSSATNFGSNNNINTGFAGSGKNFYSNNNINNSDSNSNQFNSTATGGAGNSVYGNNGFGISFGNANNNNNNNMLNNNFDNFNSNNIQSSSPRNFNSANQQANQLNSTLTSNNNNNNNRLPPRGRPPVGPASNNNFEDTFGVKVSDNVQQSEVKKVPANLENLSNQSKNINTPTNTNNNNNETKEFSTGTYDPSNILSQNRQGRMRSLGKKDGNAHEEKAAQATGSKNLPDQEPQQEVFLCPEGCGRTFNKKALAKHIPLCKKHFQPKKEDNVQEQEQKKQEVVQVKNAVEDKKQAKPPKQVKKPGSKDVKQRTADQKEKDSKNEALRKLKEQKKKELMEQNKQHENGDEDLINEPNENEYL